MRDLLERLQAHAPRLDKGIRFGASDAPQVSYAELWARAAAQSQSLSDLPPQSRILLVGDNSQAQVEMLLGCWWAGMVPVCLPPPARLTPGQNYRDSLVRWIAASEAVRGFSEPEALDRCSVESLPMGWHPLLSDSQAILEYPKPREVRAELAYIQFSSGTTLAPKGVELTPANLVHNITSILDVFPPTPDGGDQPHHHSCVSWLPLYHDMGLVGALLSALAAGGNLTLMRPYQFAARPQSWLKAVSDTRATISPAPNFALVQCLERVRDEQLEGLDLSGWQMALLGSETIFPHTLRAFHERFRQFGLRWESLTPVYGLAEATLAVTFSPPGRGPIFQEIAGRELISLGRPLNGIEVEIRPTEDAEVGSEIGEVWTRSESISAKASNDGWLNTGDLGVMRDGELYLTGRSKDILIVRGKNYEPDALEQALLNIEGLDPARAAAVALPDEQILVIGERRRKESIELAVQLDQARSAIAQLTGLVVQIHLVEAGWLPRTTSGKIRRAAAREKFLESLL